MRLFANRRLFVLLVSVILLTVTVGMTRSGRDELTWMEAGIKNTGAWLNGWFSGFSYTALAWFDDEPTAEEKENVSQLKADIARLERENRRLKEVAQYMNENKQNYITAKTVSRSPDRWNDRVVIDKGKKDQIQKDMPVITSEGLIGRVSAVTNYMADVQLLTDSGSGPGIAAQIQSGDQEIFGLIEGYDASRKRLLMKKIPSGIQPKKGQLVVTSDLSDRFPGDLLIGSVDEVVRGDFGVDRMVYVKPAAQFERLHYVMVVRDPTKIKLQKHRQKLNGKEKGNGGD
ncbi:rod shape-determining protein MreC [Melghirimyces algeriensis]|uniref:Cell shape-determining protein MreC n=1 Tax=Melghirimyces algeriensis TaxID=910412 RepID=A0A521AS07_9BACL|nr:rod shape-determining protein MreC [Melghirimyces algeriensis]